MLKSYWKRLTLEGKAVWKQRRSTEVSGKTVLGWRGRVAMEILRKKDIVCFDILCD